MATATAAARRARHAAALDPKVVVVLGEIATLDVLSEEQAAVFLRPAKPLSVETLRGWRVRGCGDGTPGPPYTKVGGAVAYLKASLIAWLQARERRTTSDTDTSDIPATAGKGRATS